MPRTPPNAPREPAASRRAAPRRRIVAALALAALALQGACREEPVRPPNLLLVVLDTTRADRIGCYGAGPGATPAIDALAARGTRFANAYAQSSLTPVSAASFLTGAWPFRTGIRSLFVVSEGELSGDVTSVFEDLRAAGRATGGFVSARPMGAHYGLDRGFDVYEDEIQDAPGAGTVRRAVQRRAEETTELALAWLDEHAGGPFAALVHYFDAHDVALLPPAPFLAEHVSFELPAGLGREPTVEQVRELWRTPERRREVYAAEVTYMDDQVRRLLERLEVHGALENTIVCVIADHGESLGEHGFWDHGMLWEEQLRVPLLLAGPGVPAGAVVDARVRLVDLAPTLAELLGLDATGARRDGVSALDLARGAAPTVEPRPLYAEVRHAEGDRLDRPPALHAVTLGEWKLVTGPGGAGARVYDLDADPGELRMLDPARDDRAARHLALLEAWGAWTDGAARLEGVPADVLDDLRELGYLGTDEE